MFCPRGFGTIWVIAVFEFDTTQPPPPCIVIVTLKLNPLTRLTSISSAPADGLSVNSAVV